MSSPNFEFLRSQFPLLAQLASTAESYAVRDPVSALVKLRQFGEQLAKTIADKVHIELDVEVNQHDRLQALGAAGHLPRSICDGLHALRMSGNSAVHKDKGSEDDAAAMIRKAFEIARWFRETHYVTLPEPRDYYQPVSDAGDRVEHLRAELQELRRLVASSATARAELPPIDLAAELERVLAPNRERYQKELKTLRRDLERMRAKAESGDTPPAKAKGAAARATNRFVLVSTPSVLVSPSKSVLGRKPPICPTQGCGAPMERVEASKSSARHGIVVGDPIWRCSRYPTCKGWVTVTDSTAATASESAQVSIASTQRPRRRAWCEFGTREGWDVSYVNCGGRLRSSNHLEDLTEPERHALSQTVVFTTAGDASSAGGDNRFIASIARRLLSRGLLPPVDPKIEQEILGVTGLMVHAKSARHPGDMALTLDRAAPLPNLALIRAAVGHRDEFTPDVASRQPNGTPLLHDDAELPFFRDWVPAQGASGVGHWWHVQASLDSLLPKVENGARRLDFLYSSPHSVVGVEVDGRQHMGSRAVDDVRDGALANAGIKVVRVPSEEVKQGTGPKLKQLARMLGATVQEPVDRTALMLVWAPVVAHRVALGIAEALQKGWLPGEEWLLEIEEPLGIAVPAVICAAEMLTAIAGIWTVPVAPRVVHMRWRDERITLTRSAEGAYQVGQASLTGDCTAKLVKISVEPFRGPFHRLPKAEGRQVILRSTYLPVHFVDDRLPGGLRQFAESAAAVPAWALQRLLGAVFAKRAFQPDGPNPRGQEVAIRRILAGQDTVVLLPTGAGKSLIYQLAGLLTPGLTLIIDPIVALIEDQLDGLRRQGIDRAIGITSADSRAGTADEKLAQLQAGDALFAFIAPERLQQQRFRAALRTMSAATPINLIVVDEAHCVSEWGHDFRTSYLDIGRVLRHVAADARGAPPPLLALTGTASRAVLKDMLIELSVDRTDPDVVVTPSDFNRPELRFGVVQAEPGELIGRVIGALNALPSHFSAGEVPRSARELLRPRGEDSTCGIVFCQTINGENGVAKVASAIASAFQVEAPIYAGTAPRGIVNFDKAKRQNASRFKDNDTTLLVATKSYGMGIDKPNVRFIIHVGIPASIEGYYQEAGRAGRDRKESVCLIVHGPEGRETLDYFHGKAFAGINAELQSLTTILDLLLPANQARPVPLPFSEDEGNRERAIHRLQLLDLVRDYTVDFGGKKFDVRIKRISPEQVDAALLRFVRRNQPGRVPDFERRMSADASADLRLRMISRAKMMIDYVYETIVASRKRAADEMEALAVDGTDDAVIRDRILKYLALGRVAASIEEIVDREPFRFEDWTSLLDGLDSAEDAREWRGTTARYLASDPDNPGLLLGRGMAEAAVPHGDVTLFTGSLESAMRSASGRYSVERTDVGKVIVWSLAWLSARRPDWRALVYGVVERAVPDASLKMLEPLERAAMNAPHPEPGELAVVLSRKLSRLNASLHRVTGALQEIN